MQQIWMSLKGSDPHIHLIVDLTSCFPSYLMIKISVIDVLWIISSLSKRIRYSRGTLYTSISYSRQLFVETKIHSTHKETAINVNCTDLFRTSVVSDRPFTTEWIISSTVYDWINERRDHLQYPSLIGNWDKTWSIFENSQLHDFVDMLLTPMILSPIVKIRISQQY